MMTALAVAAIACLALTACGPFHRLSAPGALSGAATPARVSSPARTASPPRLESPSPLPTQTPAPTPPALAGAPCRIPLAYISEAYGWFIGYPGGNRIEAPDSQVALPGGTPGAIGQNPGLTYDHATRTWEPVPYLWLSPDGSTYAYGFQSISAVNVRTGAVTKLAPGAWNLFGVSNAGAYAWDATGAALLPFDGGQAQRIAAGGYWFGYSNGAIWRDSGISPDPIVRHVLATGAEKTVTTLHGWNTFQGFDAAGDPIMQTAPAIPSSSPQTYNLIVVHPNGSVVTIYSGEQQPEGYAVGDAHGIWFERGGGLYLWRPGVGARQVSDIEGNISGPCG